MTASQGLVVDSSAVSGPAATAPSLASVTTKLPASPGSQLPPGPPNAKPATARRGATIRSVTVDGHVRTPSPAASARRISPPSAASGAMATSAGEPAAAAWPGPMSPYVCAPASTVASVPPPDRTEPTPTAPTLPVLVKVGTSASVSPGPGWPSPLPTLPSEPSSITCSADSPQNVSCAPTGRLPR